MNKIIIQNNKKCQLITDNSILFNNIRNLLSYKLEGVEFTPAYQNGWDGINYLMNAKGIFPLGLIKMVQIQIRTLGQEVIIEDTRKPTEQTPEIDITQTLIDIKKIPREHQVRTLGAVVENRKGIIRVATGGGKSLISALITAKFNQPSIVYVIGLDLLQQFHDLFSSIFSEEIGFIGNGICNIKRINIASVWTIGRALSVNKKDIVVDDELTEEDYSDDNKEQILQMLQQTKVHIFDECHTITCSTMKEIYNKIDPERIYGLSGTPYRDDGGDLLITGILGEQIINVSASELIEKGLLVQPIIKFVSIPKMSNLSKEHYATVYKEYVVENPARNAILLREIKMLVEKGYKVLVLFKQIVHGKILFELLKLNKINCEMLYGNDSLDKRNEVKEMVVDGEINVILASTIFDIGIDVPALNALVLCGGGKGTIRSLQRIGRVIRSNQNKKWVAVVDTFDQVKYLKKHSQKRYEIYLSENGFKVHKCKGM